MNKENQFISKFNKTEKYFYWMKDQKDHWITMLFRRVGTNAMPRLLMVKSLDTTLYEGRVDRFGWVITFALLSCPICTRSRRRESGHRSGSTPAWVARPALWSRWAWRSRRTRSWRASSPLCWSRARRHPVPRPVQVVITSFYGEYFETLT